MGEAKTKRRRAAFSAHSGLRSEAEVFSSAPREEESASKPLSKPSRAVDGSRERVNLSLGPELKSMVSFYARKLGMTESQVVVHGFLLAVPQLQQLVVSMMRIPSQGDEDV